MLLTVATLSLGRNGVMHLIRHLRQMHAVIDSRHHAPHPA
jgi:hypothetical protein